MQRGWQEDFASAPILFRLLHATPTPGRLEIEPPTGRRGRPLPNGIALAWSRDSLRGKVLRCLDLSRGRVGGGRSHAGRAA